MIDISDGLSSETHHICKCSKVGAQLDELAIPLAPGIEMLSKKMRQESVYYALDGGEDFELLFSAQEEDVAALQEEFKLSFNCALHKVGSVVTQSKGISLVRKDGNVMRLSAKGWNHFSDK